ncbi:MAG TPA: glycosyltransferase family 4 protein [Candidatus Polarisedimenticolia bacterium]|nr:glycosyltransferase family 4 protein [Candidatus Polarisedimenticolia bacterium]
MPAPIRVLYLTTRGLRSSSSQPLWLCVRRFSADGFRCQVALREEPDSERTRGRVASMGVELHRVQMSRSRLWPFGGRRATLRRLARIVRDQRIDLVHAFQAKAAPFAVALTRATGVRHVVQLRGAYPRRSLYARLLLHRANVVLAPSESLLRLYEEMVGRAARPGQRRAILPPAIDVEGFRKLKGSLDVRSELGMAPGQPLVGLLGPLSPASNHRLALEVARRVHAERPEARFLFLGRPAGAGALERFSADRARMGLRDVCMVAGPRPSSAPYAAAMDLLLHTSAREAHPGCFNKAMAFAKPIVASRVPGQQEAVEHGATGLLCSPGDAVEMATAVSSLLDSPDLRRLMGGAGKRRVQRLYSSDRSLPILETLYREVARPGAS